MEEYKPPKMFPDLSAKIADEVAGGEWKKLRKGRIPKSQEAPASSVQKNISSAKQETARDTKKIFQESELAAGDTPVKPGDVFKNPQDDARVVVERVSSDMVHATEYGPAPGKGILHERRIIGRPLHNFQVHVRMQEMEAVDPIQDREPAFYEEYEKQVKILGNAFSREFFACEKALDAWEESLSLKSDADIFYPLERIRLLRQRMNEIADEWESTDSRLVYGGRRYGVLLDELKSFSQRELDTDEELLKWKQAALVSLQSEYGMLEPDTIHIERGYFRGVLHSKIERLLAKCRRVKSGKLSISDEVSSLPEFEREINRLSASIVGYDPQNVDAESTAVEIKKVLDLLNEMDRVAFQGESNGNGRDRVQSKEKASPRRKKMKSERNGDADRKRVGGVAKKGRERGVADARVVVVDTQAPVVGDAAPMEETSAEQLASYRRLLEEEQRGRTVLIDLADYNTIETVFSYEIDPATGKETRKKIFLPVSGDARQIVDSMNKASQREARMLWAEMNSDLEALYLGRKFILTLDFVKEEWREKFVRAKSFDELDGLGRGRNGSRAFISVDPKNDAVEFSPLREVFREMVTQRKNLPQDTSLPGFSKLFGDQLKPCIVAANKELSSLWQNRLEELGGVVYEGGGERVIPTELVDLKALERSALQAAEKYFMDKAIPAIEKTLQEFGVDLIWLLGDGKDNKKMLELALERVGPKIVAIATDYTGQLPKKKRASFEERVREAAKGILMERVMEKISRMIELKPSTV